MPKIVTVEEMREIEAATDAAGVSYAEMMDHAGRAVADLVAARIAEFPDADVLILVGPGNNGGDGLVAGRLLAEETDAQVHVYLYKLRDDDDVNFAKIKNAEVLAVQTANAETDEGGETLRHWLNEADVVVDALLGTGARLPVRGGLADLLAMAGDILARRRAGESGATYVTPAAPQAAAPDFPIVVAVDCPSGLDCDTGEIDPEALPADETITFAAVKVGQIRFPGAGKLGRLHVADIGTPPDLEALDEIALEMADGPMMRRLLPARPVGGHKGTFGKAMVVAGSANYVGAAALAALGAYRVGAGLVTVGTPQMVVPALASRVLEATWLLLPHDMGVLAPPAVDVLRGEVASYGAMLLGPGWGQEKATGDFLRQLLRPEEAPNRAIGFVQNQTDEAPAPVEDLPPLVIDADGLNLLAKIEGWPALLPAETVLTPHPGEMGRLCDTDAGAVQSNRVEVARTHAEDWGCVVVLKGAHTVVAAPDGRVCVMPFASSALAAAGTGDVLAGAVVGLRAQGLEAFEAAAAAAYLHGLAGVMAAGALGTPASVTAGDVVEMLPEALALVGEAVN